MSVLLSSRLANILRSLIKLNATFASLLPAVTVNLLVRVNYRYIKTIKSTYPLYEVPDKSLEMTDTFNFISEWTA
jgi:hypothetical protein